MPEMNKAQLKKQLSEQLTDCGRIKMWRIHIRLSQQAITALVVDMDEEALGTTKMWAHINIALLNLFNCLDAPFKLLKERGCISADGYFMDDWNAQDVLAVEKEWKAIKEYAATDYIDPNKAVFRVNQLWNTFKHFGVMPATVSHSGSLNRRVLRFPLPNDYNVDVLQFLREFSQLVKAWIDKVEQIIQ